MQYRKQYRTMDPTACQHGLAKTILLSGILIVLILIGATIIFYPRSHITPPPTSSPALPDHYALAPTNGVLTQYLAAEGEVVSAMASLAQFVTPENEQRIREARAAVVQARLNLESARLSIQSNTSGDQQSAARPALQAHNNIQPLQQAIRDRERRINELSIALTSAEAKLAQEKSQPFGRQGSQPAIEALEHDIARLQSKRNVARNTLQQLQKQAATQTHTTRAPQPRDNDTVIANRKIEAATETLKRKQQALADILTERSQTAVTLRAPFAGQITHHLRREGEYVRQGQAVLTLQQRTP